MNLRSLVLFLLSSALFPASLAAQGVRFGDSAPITRIQTIANASGNFITAVQGLVNFCAAPANAVPCTNKATTYTDATLTTPCSTSTQLTIAYSGSCVGITDIYGNWGVWAPAGTYAYTFTISGQSFGPFPATLGGSGGGSGGGTPGGNLYELQYNGLGSIFAGVTGSAVDPVTFNIAFPGAITANGPITGTSLNSSGAGAAEIKSTAGATPPTTCTGQNGFSFAADGSVISCRAVAVGGTGVYAAFGGGVSYPLTAPNSQTSPQFTFVTDSEIGMNAETSNVTLKAISYKIVSNVATVYLYDKANVTANSTHFTITGFANSRLNVINSTASAVTTGQACTTAWTFSGAPSVIPACPGVSTQPTLTFSVAAGADQDSSAASDNSQSVSLTQPATIAPFANRLYGNRITFDRLVSSSINPSRSGSISGSASDFQTLRDNTTKYSAAGQDVNTLGPLLCTTGEAGCETQVGDTGGIRLLGPIHGSTASAGLNIYADTSATPTTGGWIYLGLSPAQAQLFVGGSGEGIQCDLTTGCVYQSNGGLKSIFKGSGLFQFGAVGSTSGLIHFTGSTAGDHTIGCIDANCGSLVVDGVTPIGGGGGSSALSGITAAVAGNTLANANFTQTWNWFKTTNSTNAFNIGETTAGTATASTLLNIATLNTSTLNPLTVTAQGTANGIQVDTSGSLAKIGTGSISADKINTAAVPTSAAVLGSNGSNQLIAAGGVGQVPNGSPAVFTSTPTLGASGTLGSVTMGNATSGTIVLQPVTGALGSVTVSLPAATDTLTGKATTDTLSNKTLNAAASGNAVNLLCKSLQPGTVTPVVSVETAVLTCALPANVVSSTSCMHAIFNWQATTLPVSTIYAVKLGATLGGATGFTYAATASANPASTSVEICNNASQSAQVWMAGPATNGTSTLAGSNNVTTAQNLNNALNIYLSALNGTTSTEVITPTLVVVTLEQ